MAEIQVDREPFRRATRVRMARVLLPPCRARAMRSSQPFSIATVGRVRLQADPAGPAKDRTLRSGPAKSRTLRTIGDMRVSYQELSETLRRALLTTGLEPDRAALCARLIADSTCDGVPSHGLNLFPRLMTMIRTGVVDARARAAPA